MRRAFVIVCLVFACGAGAERAQSADPIESVAQDEGKSWANLVNTVVDYGHEILTGGGQGVPAPTYYTFIETEGEEQENHVVDHVAVWGDGNDAMRHFSRLFVSFNNDTWVEVPGEPGVFRMEEWAFTLNLDGSPRYFFPGESPDNKKAYRHHCMFKDWQGRVDVYHKGSGEIETTDAEADAKRKEIIEHWYRYTPAAPVAPHPQFYFKV